MTWRLAALVCALAALALTGCGDSTREPDLVNGKRLFVGQGTCGACHTMKRAGTQGNQGPNLDAAFEIARKDGFGKTGIEGVVRNQIAHPRRGSAMPANLVKGDDRDDVAAYVAEVAGKSGSDTGALASVGGNPGKDKVAKASGGTLTIPADPTGQLYFAFGKAEAPAGPITIEMPNKAKIEHNIAIEGLGKGKIVGAGATSSFKATLVKGKTYKYICEVQGHAVTMNGVLTVK
jgi:mono/diheme cytochrome c family protein